MGLTIWGKIRYSCWIAGTLAGIIAIVLLFSAIRSFPIIDTELYVTPVQAYDIIASLTESQIATYRVILAVDFLFPILYNACIALCMAYFLDKRLNRGDVLRRMLPLPILTMLLDFSENISILAILGRYPQQSWAAAIVGYLTAAKWGSLILTLIVLLISILFYAIKKSGLFGE